MPKSLLALESSLGLGSPAPRRRRGRHYDERHSIVLRCPQEQVGEPERMPAPVPAPAEPMPVPPPAVLTDPREAPPWKDLEQPPPAPPEPVPAPPPAQPAPQPAPPPQKEPAFTARDDEAAAAAFSTPAPPPIMAESRSADASEFLTRAVAEAPTPGTFAAPAPEPEPDDEEATVSPAEQPQVAHGHEIFDRMAAQAEQFDLGAVALDLESAFDTFDEEYDQAEQVPTRRAEVLARPLPHVGKVDALADLAEIYDEREEKEEPEEEEQSLALDAEQSFHVMYDVPLVPQQTGMSCWAAGAAMLVAWRDQISVDPAEIGKATGYWDRYRDGLHAEDTTMFKAWGLVPEPAQTYTVQGFRNLLERWGPLWVGSLAPGPHIRVVAGLSGDGTPEGTTVHILDPWEPGMQAFRQPNAGGRYTETYAEFERKQAALARQESHLQGIYVAHVDRERRTP